MSDPVAFLDAVFAAHDGLVRFDGGEVVVASDVGVALAGNQFSYVEPQDDQGMVSFVFGVQDDVEDDAWLDCQVRPTAALYNNGTMILCWAFDKPQTADDVAGLAEALGMESTSEAVPLPGTKGWRLVHDDPNSYHTLDALSRVYGSLQSATTADADAPPWDDTAEARYGDAAILSPYDETDPALAQEIIVTLGADTFSKKWKPTKMPIGQLVAMFCQHKVGEKDGPGVVLGDQVPGQRVKSAVKALYAVGLDLDDGVPSAEVDAALRKFGHLAIRYTTHSHLKGRTEFNRDALVKWSNKNADGADIDDDLVRRYMRDKDKIAAKIVETARIVGEEHKTAGIMVQVDHAPIPKHRIVIPLKRAFVIEKEGASQVEAQDKWKKVPRAVADALRLPLDEACLDVSRLFYLPRHAKGKPYEISLNGGPLFDWATLTLENPWEDAVAELSKGKGKSTTEEGRALGRWSMKAAHGFQVVQVIEEYAPEKMRHQVSSGWEIECPFDEEHSNPGDPDDRACMAVNAGDGPVDLFTVSCRHESCRERTNLDMLGKMIEDRWFSADVLEDEAYNTAEVEDAPNPEVAKKIDKQDKAKAQWVEMIEALTEDSPSEDVEDAIRTCLEADLSILDEAKLAPLLKKHTGLTASICNRMVGVIKKELSREANEGGTVKDPKGRSVFSYTGEFNFDEAYDTCFKVLTSENRKSGEPVFCCVNGEPVRLNRKLDGRIEFVEIQARTMWSELNTRVTFVRQADNGVPGSRGQVPTDVANHVFEQAYTRLPEAPEILYTPLFIPSDNQRGARLIAEPGWYDKLDILMADTGFKVPPVEREPTNDDVEDAVYILSEEVLGDFPFLDHDMEGNERREPSLANALAMIITPFMRRLIDGCTPVFFISKPMPGTGGTLLGRIPILLFDGHQPAPMRYTQNEEEMQKALLAEIMKANSHLFFDDVKDFNNRSLLQSITSRQIGGRLLGATKTVERPNRFNWIATGNNPFIQNEMERRIVWIRLNAKIDADQMQKRTFRHKNYEEFLTTDRPRLVWAVLTLIQNWIDGGMVPFTLRTRSSFEDWSSKVGGVLQAAGIEGFLDNRKTASADMDEAAVRSFVRDWFARYGKAPATPQELFAYALDNDMEICDGNNDDQKKSRFQKRLPGLDGRTFPLGDGHYMVRTGTDADGSTTYYFQQVDVEEAVAA